MGSAKRAKKTGKSKKNTKARTKSKPQISSGGRNTGDGKETFDLYLRNLPHLITEDDLRDYFSRFGDLKSVEIHKKGSKNHVYKYGLVSYKDAASAAAASRKKEHFICKRGIVVRLSDNLKQQAPRPKDRRVAKRSEENVPKKCPILRLNYDCFLHLSSFLSLREKINLSETCVRLSGFLKSIFEEKRVLSICEQEPLALMQLKQLLVKVGHQLHQIKIENFRCLEQPIPSVELIPQMCPNLQELRMRRLLIKEPSIFMEIGFKLHHLTTIQLQNCGITKDMCNDLTFLQNVEYMDLSYNRTITGVHLDKFPKLLYLNVKNCSNLHPYYLYRICKRGKLKMLNIINCYNLYNFDNYTTKAILKLKNLEDLLINYSSISQRTLPHMQRLKALTLDHIYFLSVDFFQKLAENKSEQLESLTLVNNPLNDEIIEFIYKFKNLKKLCLSYGIYLSDSHVVSLSELKQLEHLGFVFCRGINPEAIIQLFEQPTGIKELDLTGYAGITDEVIFEIAERMKSRRTESPCTIYIGNRTISKKILKDKRYMDYAPFVKISFEDFFKRADTEGFIDDLDFSDDESDGSELYSDESDHCTIGTFSFIDSDSDKEDLAD